MSNIESVTARAGFVVRTKIAALPLLASTALLATASFSARADVGTDIADAFTNGSANVSFRYRYENVDQDGFVKDADASTLRSRLTFRTASYQDVVATLELEDVRALGRDNYNSTRNGVTDRPVVADPEGSDVSVASLTYSGLEGTNIIFGRQRIKRNNDRFIGNVGWRQNDQTYDAISIDYSRIENFNFYYAYLTRVKRIFGPDSGSPVEDLDSESHIAELSYAVAPELNATVYGYWLDLGDADDPSEAFGVANSNRTFGVRLTGAFDELVDDVKFGYVAEYATQSDHKDNPVDYDAGYYRLEAKADWSRYGFLVGYEVLESDGPAVGSITRSFSTPLATLHAHNGWADQFLATPADGLEDLFVAVSANVLGGKLSLIWHDFEAESGSTDYGDELDLAASWKINENYSVLAKAALYDADELTSMVDTDKFWIMLSANF